MKRQVGVVTVEMVIQWLKRFPKRTRFVYTNEFKRNGQMCLFTRFIRHYFRHTKAYIGTGGDFYLKEGTIPIRGIVPFHDDFWRMADGQQRGVYRNKAIETLYQIHKLTH